MFSPGRLGCRARIFWNKLSITGIALLRTFADGAAVYAKDGCIRNDHLRWCCRGSGRRSRPACANSFCGRGDCRDNLESIDWSHQHGQHRWSAEVERSRFSDQEYLRGGDIHQDPTQEVRFVLEQTIYVVDRDLAAVDHQIPRQLDGLIGRLPVRVRR